MKIFYNLSWKCYSSLLRRRKNGVSARRRRAGNGWSPARLCLFNVVSLRREYKDTPVIKSHLSPKPANSMGNCSYRDTHPQYNKRSNPPLSRFLSSNVAWSPVWNMDIGHYWRLNGAFQCDIVSFEEYRWGGVRSEWS